MVFVPVWQQKTAVESLLHGAQKEEQDFQLKCTAQ
jgi:hypothetical protein